MIAAGRMAPASVDYHCGSPYVRTSREVAP